LSTAELRSVIDKLSAPAPSRIDEANSLHPDPDSVKTGNPVPTSGNQAQVPAPVVEREPDPVEHDESAVFAQAGIMTGNRE
jgi:hypothetical protein